MRYCVRLWLAVAAVALFTTAAGASPITYDFSASTQYVIYTVSLGSVSIQYVNYSIPGTFVADGNSLLSWSFDFSALAGKSNPDGMVLQPFDDGGSYVLDNYNSTYAVSSGYDYEFSATGGGSFSHLFLYFGSGGFGTLQEDNVGGNGHILQTPIIGGAAFEDFFNPGGGATRVEQTTPEPATWMLAGIGMLLLAGLAYHERRRAGVRGSNRPRGDAVGSRKTTGRAAAV